MKIVNHKILIPISPLEIKDFVHDWFGRFPDDFEKEMDVSVFALQQKVMDGDSYYFNESKLSNLRKPDHKIEFNRDTKNTMFRYFQNGFIKITSTGHTFYTYDKLEYYIWDSQILPRSIDLNRIIKKPRQVTAKFIEFVAGHNSLQKIKDLRLIIGYLLHDYYDYKLKIPILTDSGLGDADESNGRTGKTLLSKMIGYSKCEDPEDPQISVCVEINGKDFDNRDAGKYSAVTHDTKLVTLNDVHKGFKIDYIFNDVTEGLMAKQLYKEPVRVKCKMLLTSNRSLFAEDDSARDRVIEFEFSNYFSPKHTPEHEFKHWLFTSWNSNDWHEYDMTMIRCSQEFLSNGSKMNIPKNETLHLRKLVEHTKPEFVEFMNETVKPEPGEKYYIDPMFSNFVQEFKDFENSLKLNTFTKWVKYYNNNIGKFKRWNSKDNISKDREKGRFYRFIVE